MENLLVFYPAQQGSQKPVAKWSLRLEGIECQFEQSPSLFLDVSKEMPCTKFWGGLPNHVNSVQIQDGYS